MKPSSRSYKNNQAAYSDIFLNVDNILKKMLYYIFQGYHFKCLLCKKIPKYFKAKYDVRRHLQDQHSGVGFQCSLCGYLFNRRSMKHSCNASEEDMEYVIRLTGEYGEEAKQKLHTFINEEQDGHWEYVTYDEYTEEHTRVRSKVVKKTEPPIVPRSREECVSPISMAEPDISLEEPPRIVKQLETPRASSPTLSDISSLSSYSFSSSSGSSSSCSCSDSDSDSDNDNDLSKETEKVVEVKRHKRTEMKANEERVTEKETGREKNIEDKNNNRKDNGKENEVEKEKCRDTEKQKSKERSKKATNEIQKEIGKSNVKEKEKVQGKEIEKDKETEKVCDYEKVKGGNTKEKEPEKNKKVTDKRKETEKLSANGENVKEKEVKSNENERRKQNEKENTCQKNKGTKEKEKNSNIKQKETENVKRIETMNVSNQSEKETENVKRIETMNVSNQSVKETENVKRIETMNVSSQSEKKEKVTTSNENDKEKYNKTHQKETENVERIEIMTDSSKSEKEKVTNSCEKEKEKGNQKENKCRNRNDKYTNVEEQSKTNQKDSRKDEDNEINKTCNSSSTNEKPKRKISIKEYEARKLVQPNELMITDLNCDLEVDNIMRDITNTYQFMQRQPISPVISEPQLNDAMNNEMCIETANAVAGLEKELIKEAEDKAIEEISETVIEVAEFGMINNEIDEIIEGVVQDQRQEEDIVMLERTVKRAEKRKREELEDIDENKIARRRLDENIRLESCGEKVEREQMEMDDDLEVLRTIQSQKVILNVGGARFETSRLTLRRDPNSLLAKLFTTESSIIPQGNSVFIDRDASHFKIILNYLRYDLEINPAILPKERKYLLELKKECEYFRVKGLLKIVKRRLKYATQLYGID